MGKTEEIRMKVTYTLTWDIGCRTIVRVGKGAEMHQMHGISGIQAVGIFGGLTLLGIYLGVMVQLATDWEFPGARALAFFMLVLLITVQIYLMSNYL